jgi:hypothetical protein
MKLGLTPGSDGSDSPPVHARDTPAPVGWPVGLLAGCVRLASHQAPSNACRACPAQRFAPAENLVAVAAAPPTIDAALKASYDSAAIYFPFPDVLVANPYKDIADGLKRAFYIGQSHVVGGTR